MTILIGILIFGIWVFTFLIIMAGYLVYRIFRARRKKLVSPSLEKLEEQEVLLI